MSAAALMMQQRYGYGPNRGPRRMPARMANRFVYGPPDPESFGVDIPDDEFDSVMASMGTAVGQLGTGVRALAKHRYGGVGEAVVSEMFGQDEEDADEDLEAHEEAYTFEKSASSRTEFDFKLPTLPSWVLPAAIGTAAGAGAIGLGLALTAPKRRAKRESMGALGETVAASMFGDPDEDDEFFGMVPAEDQRWLEPTYHDAYGQAHDFFPLFSLRPGQAPVFPDPSTLPSPAPSPPLPPTPAGREAGAADAQAVRDYAMPSWRQYKKAQHQVYRATKKVGKAQEKLAAARMAAPVLPELVGRYGCTPNFPGARYGRYAGMSVIGSTSALNALLSQLPALTAAQIDKKVREFIVSYLGLPRAYGKKSEFEEQYARFAQAAHDEGGLGPRAQAEAEAGIRLIERHGGSMVSSLDREALRAISRAQASLVVRGLAPLTA